MSLRKKESKTTSHIIALHYRYIHELKLKKTFVAVVWSELSVSEVRAIMQLV